ncbi:hypothetical protein ACMYSQ_008569 [Aspergillus niger]
MSATMDAARRFFLSPQFAVAGASNDRSKFGYKMTLALLKEAHSVGIPAVWLQPGTYDKSVLDYLDGHFEAAVVGDGGVGGEGWCVLVDGENALREAHREWKAQL